MPRTSFAVLVGLASVAIAAAQPVVTVHDISPGSANPLLSGSNVGLDIHVALSGAAWLTGGVNGTAARGSFRYAFDSNSSVVITNTRSFDASDEVTMISKPRGQTANNRFRANGAVSAGIGYSPAELFQTTSATDLNVAFFADAGGFTETVDGFIARVVVDLTASGIDPLDVYAVAGTTPTDAGHTLIASGIAGAGAVGHPNALEPAQQTLWSLFAIPEPVSLALLVIGGLAACRRR